MNEIIEGSVVIVSSGQIGTVVQESSGDYWVLLANGDIWLGRPSMMHIPQSQEEIDAAPLNHDRFAGREKPIASPKKAPKRYED